MSSKGGIVEIQGEKYWVIAKGDSYSIDGGKTFHASIREAWENTPPGNRQVSRDQGDSPGSESFIASVLVAIKDLRENEVLKIGREGNVIVMTKETVVDMADAQSISEIDFQFREEKVSDQG